LEPNVPVASSPPHSSSSENLSVDEDLCDMLNSPQLTDFSDSDEEHYSPKNGEDIMADDQFTEEDYTVFGLDACDMDINSGLDTNGVDLQSSLPAAITIEEDFDAEVHEAGKLLSR
jgi:hypothetical protein